MRHATRTAQGAPCWVSLLTHDLTLAERFYGGLFGWAFQPGTQKFGPYVVAVKDGSAVAGLAAAAQRLGMPVSWTAYFHADSADAVADRVRERGATVAVGPVGVGHGRVAWAADPDGAVFGIWEGEIDPSWRIGDSPGAPAWIELRTGDAFAAAIFYGEVFGWDNEDPDRFEVRYEHDRVLLRIDGRTVAGLLGVAPEGAGQRIPPRWHVYFRVEDVDETAREAARLGGSVVAPPGDSPLGRVATIRDPEGGLFSITARQP